MDYFIYFIYGLMFIMGINLLVGGVVVFKMLRLSYLHFAEEYERKKKQENKSAYKTEMESI